MVTNIKWGFKGFWQSDQEFRIFKLKVCAAFDKGDFLKINF